MSAYLMCTPRKWFGTLAKYIFPEIPVISDVVTIVITIPLLIVVIKYISPYIIKLKEESKNIISMFFLLPLTYYILEYALTVYTNLLYTGKAVIIEFMDSFIVVLYFFLSIVTLSMSNKKNTAERENIILSAAAAQAEKEISQLTDYQKQAAIYRHDLRHHMNFIQSCLAGNNTQQALEYINEINNIPGSLAFYLFEPLGISFTELLNILIHNAMITHHQKSQKVTTFRSNILTKKSSKLMKK